MKRKRYTDQEKQELLKNPNILKVGNSNATYCPRFKVRAVKAYYEGKSPLQIFIDEKINVNILGRDNPLSCLKKWRKILKEKGEKGLLCETRGTGKSAGRPRTKPITLKEAEARIAYLEAENEFLKKLDLIERGLM